jgi:indole-3-glycerol phosphate synthase
LGFLEQIVRETGESLDAPTYADGIPEKRPLGRPSFRLAIERDRASGALVVEYKRASPGQPEPLLPSRSIAQFLESTRAARPSAYSCLATVARFDGSPRDVGELASSTDLPVLFKDIVIDPRQVDVAARSGASAILLIARLETEGHLSNSLSSLAEAAHRAGLEVLLEFHARTELRRLAGVRADVYGVNARNLDTLALDRATAAETLREAGELRLRPLLGLSGVADASDAARFWDEAVDGILVGSAVARARDPAGFLSSLRRSASGAHR